MVEHWWIHDEKLVSIDSIAVEGGADDVDDDGGGGGGDMANIQWKRETVRS